ncbi:DUF4178 domain-containing protein [Mucilaginibacter sp. BJC16-A38]|uniref:DUF4178 domain-containing protein n=1 Tax=Mucilaginibacter phenanthrenivorans TaxID=1234842 RepID=UPI0021574E39|nr:DUF4178 domain-containing protein [Mucilaginibacter phenanthrenivorans]MCR8560365.1 DUF4178 domain-containing protein [Mucilaginibacter phenanthrenivorans]
MATVNLRTFPEPQELHCPHCAKPVTLFDPEGCAYVVCSSCWSYLKYIDQKSLQTQQTLVAIRYEHILEPGAVGQIKGTDYKVLAYLEKKEGGTNYEWREYMLYSYTKGYAFLAEYNGHWSFIAGVQHFPGLKDAALDGDAATLNNVEYLEFNRYTPVITALKGEFDWDVYDERIGAREFVSPPWMLVREKNKKNPAIVDWYLGEYITPQEISDGFKITTDKFPEQADIGANQPNPTKLKFQQTLRISIAAAVIVLLIQVLCFVLRPSTVILNKSVALLMPPAAKTDTAKRDTAATTSSLPGGTFEFQSLKTSSFTINNGPAAVDIHVAAPLDNNWLEATYELVSEKDNQTWDVSQEIEYYHGYEDGESWSEGSNDGTITIDDVPPGAYHLNVYPYSGTMLLSNIDLTVTTNVILWQNMLTTLLVLALAPLGFWYFQRRFEVNRWMNSDFSPYNKNTGNSDD